MSSASLTLAVAPLPALQGCPTAGAPPAHPGFQSLCWGRCLAAPRLFQGRCGLMLLLLPLPAGCAPAVAASALLPAPLQAHRAHCLGSRRACSAESSPERPAAAWQPGPLQADRCSNPPQQVRGASWEQHQPGSQPANFEIPQVYSSKHNAQSVAERQHHIRCPTTIVQLRLCHRKGKGISGSGEKTMAQTPLR